MRLYRRSVFALLALSCIAATQSWSPSRAGSDDPGGLFPRLAVGRLLVATPELLGPFFPHTVVLLLDYSPKDGAFGVVVNRPTDVSLAKVLPDEPTLGDQPHRVWLGGPVGPERVTVLFLEKGAPPLPDGESTPVVDGVRLSVSMKVLHALAAARRSPDQWRAYAGYAGWAPGQLEAEVETGSWKIQAGEARLILAAHPDSVWPELIQRSEGLEARLAPLRVRPPV